MYLFEVNIAKSVTTNGFIATASTKGVRGVWQATGKTEVESFENVKKEIQKSLYFRGHTLEYQTNIPLIDDKPLQVGTLVRIKHDYYAPYTGKLATILEIDSNRGVAKVKLQDFDDAIYTLADKLERVVIEETNPLKIYRWYGAGYPKIVITAIGNTPEEAKANGLEWMKNHHSEYLYVLDTKPEVVEEDASKYFDYELDWY